MFRVVSKHWQFIQDRHYHCARNRSPPHYTAIAVNLAYTNTNMRPVIWYNVTALSIFLSSLGQDKWQMDFSRHFQSRFVPLCVHCWCCCCFWCTCSFVTGTTNQPMPVNSISSIFSSLPQSLLISWSAVNGHQRLRTSNITTNGSSTHSDRSASLSGECQCSASSSSSSSSWPSSSSPLWPSFLSFLPPVRLISCFTTVTRSFSVDKKSGLFCSSAVCLFNAQRQCVFTKEMGREKERKQKCEKASFSVSYLEGESLFSNWSQC